MSGTRRRTWGEHTPFNKWVNQLDGKLGSDRNYYSDIDGHWFAYRAQPPFTLELESKSRAFWPLKGQWEALAVRAQHAAAGSAEVVETYRGRRIVAFRGLFVISLADPDGVPGQCITCRIAHVSGTNGLTADWCREYADSDSAIRDLLLGADRPRGGKECDPPRLVWHAHDQQPWLELPLPKAI